MNTDTFITVKTVDSRTEADQIVSYLKQNEIHAWSLGGVTDIYMGASIAGNQIMVNTEDAEKAEELLKDFVPIKASFGFNRAYSTENQKNVGKLLLGLIAALLLFTFFQAIS